MAGPSAAVKWKAVARQLANVPSRVAARVAPAIERLWRATWKAGQDPYGKALPALAASTIRKKGHDKIMIESGETLAQSRVKPLPGAGIAFQTAEKTGYHLEPVGNRPARPELPLHGVPPKWDAAHERIAKEEHRKAARRG